MAKKNSKTTTKKRKRNPPRKKARSELTAKQETFVLEYSLSGNATAACIAAGYSERTAAAQGSRLLENKKIKDALGALQQQAQKEFKVTRESLYAKYEQAFKLAALTGAPAAMVSAATGMARLFGLDKYKVEHEGGMQVIVDTGIPNDQED